MTANAADATTMTRQQRVLRWLKAEALPLLAMVLLLTAARSSLANHYHVPTGSMEPTLQPGDRVFVDMTAYGVTVPFTGIELVARGTPRPGDVVVFDSPVDGTRLIKRAVAVGGDRVDVLDGHLWIDGVALRVDGPVVAEHFGGALARLDLGDGGGRDVHGLRVPEGQVLVMGDHRGSSFDGRYFGLVPESAFYGRAIAVYWRSGDGPGWREL